jgi:hypothetical protein
MFLVDAQNVLKKFNPKYFIASALGHFFPDQSPPN